MPKIKAKEKIKRELYKLLDDESKQLRQGNIKKPYKAVWYRDKVATILGYNVEDGPSLRWYEVFIQEKRRLTKSHDSLDDPWTLAASLEFNIPPSATKALFDAWRFELALHQTLTIRQARWIAYLSTVITNTAELLDWASMYAAAEKSEKILFDRFESSSWDAGFNMTYAEHSTLALLGRVLQTLDPRKGVTSRPKEINDKYDDAYNVAIIAEGFAINKIYPERFGSTDNPYPLPSNDYQVKLPNIKESNFQAYQLWIYAHWLSALSRASEWQNMPRHQIIEMVGELRQWIAELPSIVLKTQNSVNNTKHIQFSDLAYRPELIPEQLIYKAGLIYAPDFQNNWKLATVKLENLSKKHSKLKSKGSNSKADSSKE